ncbi:MAG: ORF6N domain-containing protein [Deltaproteobacteria bacterium]|nr:ORF6N domain-containing protein [Deltaproteobacteria bacterium]
MPNQILSQKIFLIRGHRVMLDSDLANLYQVPTFRLNEQVKRNRIRFPADFMFQLSAEEYESLRSQFAILRLGHGKHRKYLPFVFTEQGVAMLSSVLNSERAVLVNIEIMRAFVLVRDLMIGNKELASKLSELERKYETHDAQFKVIFDAIREIMAPVGPLKKRRIGI